MITAYIDESGDLGRGGSFFVLAAVVFRDEQGEKRVKRIIKKEQLLTAQGERRESKQDELKSCHLRFEQRQRILNKITAKPDTLFYYLVIFKQAAKILNKRVHKNLAYNYFSKLLTDMIFSDFYDHFRIIFDQRTTCVKSMNSLPDYITIGAYTNHACLDKRIEVLQRDSKTLYNLQAADIIAGTVYHAYREHKPHFLNLIKDHVAKFSEFPDFGFRGGFLPHPAC